MFHSQRARVYARLPRGTPVAIRLVVRTLARLRAAAFLTVAAGSCVAALSYPAGAGARALHVEAVPEQHGAAAPQRIRAALPRAADAEYRVAAGTALAIELRTGLSSATSRLHDVVEGRLLRALTGDDFELVPAGALILGSVTEVERATGRTPARLSFTFVVVEHPDTGSRATIRAGVLVYRSDTPQRRQPLPVVQIPQGSHVTVTLLAPLLVRIPAARPSP